MSPPELEALHARALDALVRGDTASGITDLKAYLDAEPDDADAWLELGAAYAAVGKGHGIQAADALKTAVDLDGENLAARLAYADALTKLGKTDLAAFQLVQATRLAPDDARATKALGVAFYDKKLYDKSAAMLRRAAASAPGDARTHFALGLAEEARRDVGAAIAAYREAVRVDPGFVDARRTLADALASMGEHQQAIAELNAVLALAQAGDAREVTAKNRDVLAHALDEMVRSRLLGKTAREIDASALVERGELKRRDPPGEGALRWGSSVFQLDAHLTGGVVSALVLALLRPERATKSEDDRFRVTVVGDDGAPRPVDLATAATLTFLREALGCPMTQAGTLYARLLAEEQPITWAGAEISFVGGGEGDPRPGLRVRIA